MFIRLHVTCYCLYSHSPVGDLRHEDFKLHWSTHVKRRWVFHCFLFLFVFFTKWWANLQLQKKFAFLLKINCFTDNILQGNQLVLVSLTVSIPYGVVSAPKEEDITANTIWILFQSFHSLFFLDKFSMIFQNKISFSEFFSCKYAFSYENKSFPIGWTAQWPIINIW